MASAKPSLSSPSWNSAVSDDAGGSATPVQPINDNDSHEQREKAEAASRRKNFEALCRRWEERKRNAAVSAESTSSRPTESELRRFDSSLKRCTGVVRRLRASGFGDETINNLTTEVRALNLSRYISEIVAAIVDLRIKSVDTEHAVRFCGELYRRYAEFSSALVPALTAAAVAQTRDVSVRRSSLRLLVELVAVAVINDPAPITSVVRELIKYKRDLTDESITNLSLVSSFAKSAARLFLIPHSRPVSLASQAMSQLKQLSETAEPDDAQMITSRDQRKPVISPRIKSNLTENASTVSGDHLPEPTVQLHDDNLNPVDMDPCWEETLVSADLKSALSHALHAYYRDMSTVLSTAEAQLRTVKTAEHMSRLTKGVEDEAASSSAASTQKLYDRIYSSILSLSEALCLDTPKHYCFSPDHVFVPSSTDGASSTILVMGTLGGAAPGQNASALIRDRIASSPLLSGDTENTMFAVEQEMPFDCEEERSFYRDLPDLPQPDKTAPKIPESEISDCVEPRQEIRISGKSAGNPGKASSKGSLRKGKGNSSDTGDLTLDSLLSRLNVTDSRDNSDIFVKQFCELSCVTRNASKRLIRQLIHFPATLLNVLPSYARIAASLRPRFPEISIAVASTLEEELRHLIGRTDHDEKSIAICVKTARYVGEYVKFEMIQPSSFFELLGSCVRDFNGSKVEICCHMLETCGKYLGRTATTAVRTGNILDTIWRLKSVKNLEPRHNALVETAYFAARPAARARVARRKHREPVREYIRWRLYSQLTPLNIEETAVLFRKLPWDENLEEYVVRKFQKVNRMRFSLLPTTAKLLALLSRDRNSVGVSVCDGILESIRVGMEQNDGRESQRRVAEVVLLGELFNCGLVNAPVIWQVLYELITLGHNSGPTSPSAIGDGDNVPSNSTTSLSGGNVSSFHLSTLKGQLCPPDPPGDFFRIRLVCVLLDTAGARLMSPLASRRKSSRRIVEVFWAYFERYALTKAAQIGSNGRLPLHVEHLVADTFENLFMPAGNDADSDVASLGPTDLRHTLRESTSKKGTEKALPNLSTLNETSVRRPGTLAEAMDAVKHLESSHADVALVYMPARKYVSRQQKSIVTTKNSAATGVSGLDGSSAPAEEDSDNLSDDTVGEDDMSTERNDADFPGIELENDEMEGSLLDKDEIGDENETAVTVDDPESIRLDENIEPDLENEGEDNEDADDEEDDDFDDDSFLVATKPRVRTEEENDFERELAAFTAAEVQTAKESFTGHTALDRMAIPIGLMAKRQEMERAAAAAAAATGDLDPSDPIGGDSSLRKPKKPDIKTVAFKMLVRRGGKSQLRDLEVPSASSLAVAMKESESQDAKEQEELRRLVLGSSTVVNAEIDDGCDDMLFDQLTSAKQKVKSINEQRAADEKALLSTLLRTKPR